MGDRIAGPSNELLAKVMMFTEGFRSAKIMAHRIVALCLLSRQLLSMQQHYECPFAETHLVSGRTVAAGPQANHDAQSRLSMCSASSQCGTDSRLWPDLFRVNLLRGGCSICPPKSVYPAVAAMAMRWKSSCGLPQQILGKLCFLPKPMGARVDPSREVRRDGPIPRSSRPHDTSFYSVYLDGFSHAKLKHWDQLSDPEKWSW